MQEADLHVDYSSVYPGVSAFTEETHRRRLDSFRYMTKLVEEQNFVCRVKNFNGESWCVSFSPADTLVDLYEKTETTLENGIAFDLRKEYNLDNSNLPNQDNCKIHDLFVCSNQKTINSIPRNAKIRLHDYIRSNPNYFIPDPQSPYLRTYTIYIVDKEAYAHMKKTYTSASNYWESLKTMFSKTMSCKLRGSGIDA
jgi:hypothetical protein